MSFSYRPEPTTRSPLTHFRVVSMPARPRWHITGLLCLALLLSGLFVIRLVANATYAKQVSSLPVEATEIYDTYAQTVEKKTDVLQLMKNGSELLAKNMPLYAKLNFKRASDLNTNLRDVAYGWAYTLLQSRQSSLTESDLAEIRQAIDRAERVDPHFKPLLQLKLMVAEMTGDQGTMQITQNRLRLLESVN